VFILRESRNNSSLPLYLSHFFVEAADVYLLEFIVQKNTLHLLSSSVFVRYFGKYAQICPLTEDGSQEPENEDTF